jgi:hypothetical protein
VRGTRDPRTHHARRRSTVSKRREKHVDDLERELAGLLGRQLAEEMVQWRAAGVEGEWAKCLSRTDDSQTARAFLQAVTLAFAVNVPEQADTTCQFTLLLVSSPSSQTPSSTSVVMLFGADETMHLLFGASLLTISVFFPSMVPALRLTRRMRCICGTRS